MISLCYILQESWAEAIDSLYKLAAKYPNEPEAQMFLFNIADIYHKELNEPKKAIQVYKEIIEKYPAGHFIEIAKIQLETLQKLHKSTQVEN